MKNLIFSGVKTPFVVGLIALMFTFVSCSKSESAGGGATPDPTPTPPAAKITPPAAPATPIFNGDGFTGSIGLTNAPTGAKLFVDGVENTSATLVLTNLTATKTVYFELRKADGASIASASVTIPVLKPRISLAVKDAPSGWKNTVCRDSLYSGSTWTDLSTPTFLYCPNWKFGTDNSCVFMNTASSCGGADSPNSNVFNADESKLTVGSREHTIVSWASNSFTIRYYGSTICTERTFTKQ